MYTPVKKRKQHGGEYVTTVKGNTFTVSQSTMNLVAELANVSTFATMSTFLNLNSLTAIETSGLIDTLGRLIIQEDTAIQNNESSIKALKEHISAPISGLQAIYDSTVVSYSTAVIEYYSTIDSLSTTEVLISTYTSTLSSLSTLDAYEVSSIEGYNLIYSTLYWEIQQNYMSLASAITIFTSVNTLMDSYRGQYYKIEPQYTNISKTIASEIDPLAAAYSKYIQTLTPTDYFTLSTLSTVYINDIST